jgi:carbohydrate-selective porin OprB
MLELARGIEVTPSFQYIDNPALNPEADSTVLFGLRFRAPF